MARKRHKPEEIVAKLRQPDLLTCQSCWTACGLPVRYGFALVAEALQKPLSSLSRYLTEKAGNFFLRPKSPPCGGLEMIRAFEEKTDRILASALRSQFGGTLSYNGIF